MKESRMVNRRRKGFTFMLLAPMRMAWRTGSLERIKRLSCGVYAFAAICFSSVSLNVSRAPLSSMRAALRKSEISFLPLVMMTSSDDAARKRLIFSMSLAESLLPLLMEMVSLPTKLTLSLAATAAIFVFVTSEMIFPSLSSMMRSP